MNKYTYTPTQDECKAIFISSCIESAATALEVTPEEMYTRMRNIGLIENYILPCYGVLHAESRQNLTDDIVRTINIWEQKKGLKK